MVATGPHEGAESPLWWAFVFGADLGVATLLVAWVYVYLRYFAMA